MSYQETVVPNHQKSIDILKGGDRAEDFLEIRRPKMDNFSGIYGADEVQEDKETVKKGKEIQKGEDRELSSIVEAIFCDKAETCYGKYGIRVEVPSSFDDIVNHTDAVLTLPDGTVVSLDFTVSEGELAWKFREMRKKKGGKLTELKYYEPERGLMENIPRSVLFISADNAKKLNDRWLNNNPPLDDDKLFVDLMEQIYVGILAIKDDSDHPINDSERHELKAYEKAALVLKPVFTDIFYDRNDDVKKIGSGNIVKLLGAMAEAGMTVARDKVLREMPPKN